MYILVMLKSTEASFPRLTLYLSDTARVKIGPGGSVLLLLLNIDTPHVGFFKYALICPLIFPGDSEQLSIKVHLCCF